MRILLARSETYYDSLVQPFSNYIRHCEHIEAFKPGCCNKMVKVSTALKFTLYKATPAKSRSPHNEPFPSSSLCLSAPGLWNDAVHCGNIRASLVFVSPISSLLDELQLTTAPK